MQNDKYLPPEPPAYGYTSAPAEAPQNYPPPPGYSQQGYPQYSGYPPQQVHPQQLHPQQIYGQPAYPPHPGYPPQQGYAPPPQNYGQMPPHSFEPHAPQPPPIHAPITRPTGWYSRLKVNRPQMNVLSAATLIFVSGGMNIAWSIGFRNNNYRNLSTHVQVAWFIGAIIGAAISGFLPKIIPRRAITIFCSMLVLIGGIVNVSTHYDIQAVTASLYLDGIANGLVFAPTMALAGELAVSYMRGKFSASTEQLSFNVGIFLQILLSKVWDTKYYYHRPTDSNPEQIHGILSIIFGFIAICFAALLFVESPVALIANGRDQAATDALRRLQRLRSPNSDTFAQLAEHKAYIAENKDLATEQNFSVSTLLKLTALRALNAISISSLIYETMWLSLNSNYNYPAYMYSYVIFGACRLLGSFFASFVMDSMGRKVPTLVGLVACAVLAFWTASQYFSPYYQIIYLLDIFQFFAGIAFSASSAYLTEAYPLKTKQNFISFTFIIELLVFIIITACDQSRYYGEFLYGIGGVFTGVFVLGIFWLPETRRTTLREAQKKFGTFC